MAVTFTDGQVVGMTRMTDIDVVDATPAIIGILYDFADPALIKSGWNWNLIHNDGSKGVHNPLFANNVLTASIAALAGL